MRRDACTLMFLKVAPGKKRGGFLQVQVMRAVSAWLSSTRRTRCNGWRGVQGESGGGCQRADEEKLLCSGGRVLNRADQSRALPL